MSRRVEWLLVARISCKVTGSLRLLGRSRLSRWVEGCRDCVEGPRRPPLRSRRRSAGAPGAVSGPGPRPLARAGAAVVSFPDWLQGLFGNEGPDIAPGFRPPSIHGERFILLHPRQAGRTPRVFHRSEE